MCKWSYIIPCLFFLDKHDRYVGLYRRCYIKNEFEHDTLFFIAQLVAIRAWQDHENFVLKTSVKNWNLTNILAKQSCLQTLQGDTVTNLNPPRFCSPTHRCSCCFSLFSHAWSLEIFTAHTSHRMFMFMASRGLWNVMLVGRMLFEMTAGDVVAHSGTERRKIGGIPFIHVQNVYMDHHLTIFENRK